MNIKEILQKGKITKEELQELFEMKKTEKSNVPFRLPDFKFNIGKLFVFKVLIFIVFCCASIMTVTYNYYGFTKIMDGFKAMLSSITFVLFGIACFESFIFVSINKNIRIITRVLLDIFFMAMFGLSLIIIVTNILNGQFDKYQNLLMAEKKANNDNSYTLYNEYEKQEVELKKEYDNRVNERDRQQNIFSGMIGTEKNYYNVSYRIVLLNNEIKVYENKLNVIRDKRQKLLETNTITEVRKMTLYEYFFKDKDTAKKFEFLQIVLPSLVFDIISSVSLGLIFFMKEDKEDDRNRNIS